MAATGTHDNNWGIQNKGTRRTAHKIPLVSPKMDVDVTGFSLKNVGTHLIDHPHDVGQKQREQLWNFQQKYRGANVTKFKNGGTSGSDAEDRKSAGSATDDQTEAEARNARQPSIPRGVNDSPSLPTRFKKRLNQRNLNVCGFRSGENVAENPKCKPVSKDSKDTDKQQDKLTIQRLYSSGLIVKNTLYNQLRSGENQSPDSSRLAESLQKYGPGLERLPDIQYPGSKSLSYAKHMKLYKTISAYSNGHGINRFINHKTLALRRSFSNMSDLGPSKIKLRLVERRREFENSETNADSGDNNEPEDDTDDLQADDDDECDNDNDDNNEIICHPKHPEYVDIRHNVTEFTTQDDIEVPYHHGNESKLHERQDDLETPDVETAFEPPSDQSIEEKPKLTANNRNKYKRTDLGSAVQVENYNKQYGRECFKVSVQESWASHKDEETSRESKCSVKHQTKKQAEVKIQQNESGDSDDGLDIPEDRYGPTTHSVDRKLSIRKPWEWRPSPYRWLERPFIRDSDKSYIERIVNSGDLIDHFDYDHFARTKPLKVQAFRDGAGYKDRTGTLR